MKTIKFLAVLCFILAFSANIAISQKVIGTQTIHWIFTPDQGQGYLIPCLTEVVSGDVTEYQLFTNDTYHVMPRGVLYGETTQEEYDIAYEYNFALPAGAAVHFGLSILLKHDGKLVAVIHVSGQYVTNSHGKTIVERLDVNCK